MAQEQFYCKKCNKTMNADQFYGSNNLEKYPEAKLDSCKKCISMHIDNWNPDTYLWILQECDVPYVPDQWNKLMESYARQPEKVTGMTILGRYLATMKLKQWKSYRWKDTEFLQELADSKMEQTMKRQGYEMQEIVKAIEKNKIDIPVGELAEPVYEESEPEDYFANQAGGEEISIDLTDEDRTYLKLKWGKQYRPDEWVTLEQLYEEMLNSYDIQAAGDLNTLKLACKSSLKANQLLDMGDIDGAQKATKMYDSLMKSGKWTAQQNKENESELVDSIGELVALCEREGFIPKYYSDTPQDKVDRVIEDLKHYTQDLIVNESGLGSMIETALKQIDEENERLKETAEITDEDEESQLMDYDKANIIEDQDIIDFKGFEDELAEIDDGFLKSLMGDEEL